MDQSAQFDLLEFLEYSRARWRQVAIACGTAALLTLAGALLLPRQYKASATILIEPPAGNDPRAATAVSPVYLESLRTYEHIASSDTLFLDAAKRAGVLELYPNDSVDRLRKRVLKVAKLRDTKILRIEATLPDPQKAQQLAQRIAEATVETSRRLDRQSGEAAAADVRRLRDEAMRRLNAANSALAARAGEPVSALSSEVDSLADLSGRLRREAAEARTDLADWSAQKTSGSAAESEGAGTADRQILALRGRLNALEAETRRADAELLAKQVTLEKRSAERDQLEAERKEAQAQYDLLSNRVSEMGASAGLHGERLEIADPGVVPKRPSSPDAPLMLLVALSAALAFSGLYLTAGYGLSRRRRLAIERTYRTSYSP